MSSAKKVTAAFARPWSLLCAHRRLVWIGALCIPPHAFVTLWMPRLWGDVIDSVRSSTGAARPVDLATTCWLLLAMGLAEALLRYISRRTLIDVSRNVEQELKDQALAHLQTLPVAWFDRARTGDITSRLTQDVELVRFVMGPLLLHGGSALCILPAGIYCMATMDVPVTVAAAGILGLLFAGLRMLMPRLHKWSKLSQEAIGALSQRAQEDFAGIRILWQFGAEPREVAAMARRNRRYLASNLRLVRLRSLMNAITHSTTGTVMLGVLLVGGSQVIDGHMTVGQLFQFTQYLLLLMFPLEILGWTLATMPRAFAAANRVEELFAVMPEVTQGAAIVLRGHIEVRGLVFSYPGAAKPALQDVSFDLQPGQKLGITGPVGSGKSTLLALCLRFYEPPRGTIWIDGHDVLDLSPASIRALFAFAPQEPFLFSDTVRANVAFGRPDATASDLDFAVAAAALEKDLPQLPDGLDTRVGERGVTLSGGQKQRVSLARALLASRPALLLDDTLSAVDLHTERLILQGLKATRKGRTVIAATHRLSVVTDADQILVLDEGKVRERGTHSELLSQHGLYATAYRRQSEASALGGGDQA
ncbi:MAG: ABC transporter ATP-binding protein [Planctomycetota bacterium]|nr:ABC transporter ATP-binding protein [Planctomycetota bacterium]